MLVPRAPFTLTFRPPKLSIEHAGKAVIFGPGPDGGLGFNPLQGASVEDVTSDISEYPPSPIMTLSTEHFDFAVGSEAKVFSTVEGAQWPFELVLGSATAPEEMLHVRGPLTPPVDLSLPDAGMKEVGAGQIEKTAGRADWKEWAYPQQEHPWRQRLYRVALSSARSLGVEHLFVLTAQCPLERHGEVFAFADELVSSMRSRN
jgi:hypothetical protein